MSSWEARVNDAFGPSGYENCMRRSLQTVILYEANRCIASALPTLRPFQRKLAYLDMANALVNSLDALMPHQKVEVLWRTGTSKEPMNAETAWKRRKLLNKELENIKDFAMPLLVGRTHDQALDVFIQQQFESVTGNSSPVPRNWSHTHNNAILCNRVYYRGDQLDPTFPSPCPPKDIYIAAEKPASMVTSAADTASLPAEASLPAATKPKVGSTPGAGPENAGKKGSNTPDDRRLMLKEVREHLDLLKEFEGVIPAEDLARRKRELFLAMPPAPPPLPKRAKQGDE